MRRFQYWAPKLAKNRFEAVASINIVRLTALKESRQEQTEPLRRMTGALSSPACFRRMEFTFW
jgi:hypothetical protein